VIRSRCTICAGDVAQMGETRNANWILVGTYEGENLKDLGVCGRTF